MDVNHLAYMANQIALNVAARGHTAAVEETASHIIKYWDPRMKAGMLGGDRTLLNQIATEAMVKVEAYVASRAA